MAQIGYLVGRLPSLTPEASHLPIGPEAFSELIMDAWIRHWAAGVLDWLRLANWRCMQRKLPLPYPDAHATPMISRAEDPWAGYYERFGGVGVPPVIRAWAREDRAAIAARAAFGGRQLGPPVEHAVNRRLEGLIQPASATLTDAAMRDRKTLRFQFHWLDEQVFAAGPDSPDRIFTYALKLLVLVRDGRRLEHHDAA